MCSRREADRYIEKGLVLVDGGLVSELGTKIFPDQAVELKKEARKQQNSLMTVLLNKPVGLVSGQAEKGYSPAIKLIGSSSRWNGDRSRVSFSSQHLSGLAPAGRLDIDSSGLLVLTQDGRIARILIGEDSSVDKEYLVRVRGRLTDEGLQQLNYGLSLDGKKLKPAQVIRQNNDQLRFVLREGRNRQIRRMCDLVGLKVTGLKRVRMGAVKLGRLPSGQWRYLGEQESFAASSRD